MSEADLVNKMAELDLESRQTENTQDKETVEETKIEAKTTPKAAKKKKGKKGTTAQSTDGPATRTRSRLAAFIAQQKSTQVKSRKMRIGVVFDEMMLLHKKYEE